tara:strand:- start:22589 stop:22942 length:354 start_codon:yes stop_codon:yes gene_type:complete
MTCLSKSFGIYAMMEWGLRDVKFLSPQTFSGKKGGRTMTFTAAMRSYDKDFMVPIPNFETNYLILFIPNKEGDNCIILEERDGMVWNEDKVSLNWIALNLKRKWNAKLKTTDILDDA